MITIVIFTILPIFIFKTISADCNFTNEDGLGDFCHVCKISHRRIKAIQFPLATTLLSFTFILVDGKPGILIYISKNVLASQLVL